MGHHAYSRFRPDPDAERITFALDDRTFTCVPRLPAGAVFDLGHVGSSTVRTVRFIAGCIEDPDEAEAFMVELRRTDLITEPRLLQQLLNDLMVEYGYGRPTTPPAQSPPGASSTPGTSAGGASLSGETPTS